MKGLIDYQEKVGLYRYRCSNLKAEIQKSTNRQLGQKGSAAHRTHVQLDHCSSLALSSSPNMLVTSSRRARLSVGRVSPVGDRGCFSESSRLGWAWFWARFWHAGLRPLAAEHPLRTGAVVLLVMFSSVVV